MNIIKMKLLLFNILLIIGAVMAQTEYDDSIEDTTTNVNRELQKEDDNINIKDHNKKPVNVFYSQQSHSVFNSNGNGIVVSSRFDSNGREEKYISIGSPKIRIDGEYFSCTNLSCPENAFKCSVTSEAIADDRQNMRTKAECLDKDDKVLKDTEYIETNPYPEAEPPFSRVATVDRNGGIDVEDSTGRGTFNVQKLTKEQEEKLNKDLLDQNRRMNELFAHQQRLLQQQMEALNRHLEQTFSNPNFPFGNYNPFRQNVAFPFGNNWPFGGSSGFQNNFPFGTANPFINPHPFINPNPFPENVNFDTIEVDNRHPNRFFVETSNPSNNNNPHNPHSVNPYAPQKPTKEIETVFDDSNENDNEIFDPNTNRIMVNNIYNRNNRFNEKYRYAHGY